MFQELQREQQDRIKELERKVMQKRAEHSEAMQKLKTDFLTQKRNYQNEADTKVSAMAKQANKVRTYSQICIYRRILLSANYISGPPEFFNVFSLC